MELAISAARAIAATLGMTVVILGIGRVIAQPLLFLAVGGALGAATYRRLSMVQGGKEIQHVLALVGNRPAA